MSATTRKLRRITTIGLLVGLLAVGAWFAERYLARGGAPVTVSKETTVITEPLRKDGYVDYVAASNKILSKNVTSENNALVPFWNAMGPAGVLPSNRAEYFRLLGVNPPAEGGNYFISLEKFVQKQPGAAESDVIDGQLSKAQERPWTKNEFPILAAWLEANQAPLEAVIAASRRPQYYSPLIGDDSGALLNVTLPATQEIRHATQALLVRANSRLAEGKTSACWQDLLATHRLARLCGQGFCLVEALIAQSIDAGACRGDQAVCQTVRLSAADALRMRDELNRLAPLPNTVEFIDRGERWGLLSAAVSIARGDDSRSKGLLEKMDGSITRNMVDWDTPLRIINSWSDRAVDALRKPTVKEQHRALDDFDKQLRLMGDSVGNNTASPLVRFQLGLSERVGQRLATLLFPAVGKANDWAHVAEMRVELTKLSFSLAAYRADHGAYPIRLHDLAHKYTAEIPKDVFSGNDLHYRPEGDAYVLYSVGPNGKDDGGKDRDDGTAGNTWDDIVVRMR